MKSNIKTAFISGHGLNDIYYNPYYITDLAALFRIKYLTEIDNAIKAGHNFVIGDYEGIDDWANRYLNKSNIDKSKVTIYHIGESPRYNFGKFQTVGQFINDEHRDFTMTQISDYDIAFLLPDKHKSGTAKNIKRRIDNEYKESI
jgi:hypothetical protein